jgi:hypothetical protein
MPKEQLLNMALNRWKYNQKRYVGPTSESIRRCAPKSLEEWEQYYYRNVYPKEHLVELGKRFYTKVTEVLQAEIEDITEQDCIEYIINLVINETYNGYASERETIYGQLQGYFTEKIEPAPDEWDRLYNVDFYIQVGKHYIGIQVKPETFPHAPEAVKWREVQKVSHEKFTERYGGKVFFVISVGEKKRKIIANPEVIEEIREEIERLRRLD